MTREKNQQRLRNPDGWAVKGAGKARSRTRYGNDLPPPKDKKQLIRSKKNDS